MRTTSLSLLLILAITSGCATPRYGSRIEIFGEGYLDAGSINRKVDRVPDEAAERVKVYFGSLPQGLVLKEGLIEVVPPFRHRILGKVSTTGLSGYNADRRGYCKIGHMGAAVICMFSASLIPLFGVLACPCMVGHMSNHPDNIELRKAALVLALQRATLAAGGNAVVITSLGRIATVDAGSGRVIGLQEMTGAAGYALHLAAGAGPAPSREDGVSPADRGSF